MAEAELWALMKRNLQSSCHLTRIENAVSSGQSDVNGCYNGVEFWVELKDKVLEFRPSQIAWTTQRLKAGGNVWILFRDKQGVLKIWKANSMLELAEGVEVPPVYESGKPYDWIKIRNIFSLLQ